MSSSVIEKTPERRNGSFQPSQEEIEKIVLDHIGFINSIVKRIAVYLPSYVDRDDLRNCGVIGLIDAIRKYNPNKDTTFRAYAAFRVAGAILDELRRLDWVPRSIMRRSRRIESAYREVEQRLGYSASEEDVADHLGIKLEKFQRLRNESCGISMVSFKDTQHSSSDEVDISSFAHFSNKECRHKVVEAIDKLPNERDRSVLFFYYYHDLTMKEIGEICGITEVRVSQIHAKAVKKLRSKLVEMKEK